MNSNKPTILERVQADLERGDHWLARQRLESHLSTQGYDPDILSKLGEIALAMHDGFSAGRFYMASSAVGDHVDAAIAVFVTHLAHKPDQIASQLPLVVRAANQDQIPEEGLRRMRNAGLDVALEKLNRKAARRAFPYRYPRLVVVLVVFALLFTMTAVGVGVWTIGGWVLGR